MATPHHIRRRHSVLGAGARHATRFCHVAERDQVQPKSSCARGRRVERTCMDRAAIFVDAGYVFASGAQAIAGQKLARSQLLLDYDALLALLLAISAELTGLPLLRVYWYDGASTGPTPSHTALSYRRNVKLRLGQMSEGSQQGVDELIARDMVGLAQNRAMADALLLTGDDDLRPAVETAQELGVRLHLLGITKARDNQAAALVQAADTSRELTDAEVRTFLSRRAATDART
jgi:uncharacterized LabA/DUF88 family protein